MVPIKKLVTIVGPTASGKSELSMKIASSFGGEIVCADSRTIYKGMDIGTAKPSKAERQKIRHYYLDLLDPNQPYSASLFKNRAKQSVSQIVKKNKLPIIVGGSGLYVYSVIYDYDFPAGANNKLRDKLNSQSLKSLQAMLQKIDHETYSSIDTKNPRRLIRAIETAGKPKKSSKELDENTILVGIYPGNEELARRIQKRTDRMVTDGLDLEVKSLMDKFGVTEQLKSVGYQEILRFLNGEVEMDEAKNLINLHTLQLAKRQMTWLKRNKDINWFEDPESAFLFVSSLLNKVVKNKK